jgi:hypothetical protein
VNATQIIEEIRRLPDEQAERDYQYLFSTEREPGMNTPKNGRPGSAALPFFVARHF